MPKFRHSRCVSAPWLIAAITVCAVTAFAQEHGPMVALDKSRLPEPVFDEQPGYVDLYWKAWELAWDHVHYDAGAPQSPFMDEAFANGTIWIWDTEFMALFCRYGGGLFPGVQSLYNFYGPMHDGISSPQAIHHWDNPPFFAWIEWRSFVMTGDTARVRWLIKEKKYLQRHFAWFDNQRKVNAVGYSWDGNPSGMDNTPRGRGIGYGGMFWVDALGQQALSAYCIARLAEVINEAAIAAHWDSLHDTLCGTLNRYYWNEADGIYYDVRNQAPYSHVKVKTPTSYWPLLAHAASQSQAQRMAVLARDPVTFGGTVSFPTVARNDADFNRTGQYWRGSMWLPTAYMSIKALEEYGFQKTADSAALSVLDHQYKTFRNYQPATIWECYSPTEAKPATDKDGSSIVRPNFCGWSALGPISMLIENVLGFHTIDAVANRIEWRKYRQTRHGIRRLHFGNVTADIMADGNSVTVTSTSPFTLVVNGKICAVTGGTQVFAVPGDSMPTSAGSRVCMPMKTPHIRAIGGNTVSVPQGDFIMRVFDCAGKIVRQQRVAGPGRRAISEANPGMCFVTFSSGCRTVSAMLAVMR